MLPSLLVLAAVAAVAALAARSLWRAHKSGKSCSCGGDCSHCKGCH